MYISSSFKQAIPHHLSWNIRTIIIALTYQSNSIRSPIQHSSRVEKLDPDPHVRRHSKVPITHIDLTFVMLILAVVARERCRSYTYERGREGYKLERFPPSCFRRTFFDQLLVYHGAKDQVELVSLMTLRYATTCRFSATNRGKTCLYSIYFKLEHTNTSHQDRGENKKAAQWWTKIPTLITKHSSRRLTFVAE